MLTRIYYLYEFLIPAFLYYIIWVHSFHLPNNYLATKSEYLVTLFPFSCYREARFAGATQGWATPDEDNREPEGPHDIQRRRSTQVSLLLQTSRQAARAEKPQRPGSPENLLPQAGGFSSRATINREHVYGQPSILNIHPAIFRSRDGWHLSARTVNSSTTYFFLEKSDISLILLFGVGCLV